MKKTETRVKIRFIERVRATRANDDGTRRYEVYKPGQTAIVTPAGANFRIENGHAEFVEYVDVEIDDLPPIKKIDKTKQVINQEPATRVDVDDLTIKEPVDVVLRSILTDIKQVKVQDAKKALAKLTIQGFDDYVSERELPSDSVTVISAAIEEYADLGDIPTIPIIELKDAIETVIIPAVS